MEQQTFKFSEDAIREKRRLVLPVQIVTPILAIAVLFIPDVDLTTKIICTIVVALCIEIFLIAPEEIMYKKFRGFELTITDDGFERKSGSGVEKIKFNDINSVSVTESTQGGIVSIDVESPSGFTEIWGFEKLDLFLSALEAHLTNKSVINRKKVSVNITKSSFMLLVVLIGMALVILWIQGIGGRLFNGLVSIALAAFLFWGKPTSRTSGSLFRKFEIIISVILLLFGIIKLFGL